MSDEMKDYKFLPKKYHFAHDYCLMLHDVIVGSLVEAENANLNKVSVKFTDEETELLEEFRRRDLAGRELIDFLETNGKVVDIFILLYAQVLLGLTSDFCHFIYEGLESSKKGKMTVCFSLLRKPLVENLLYLEYLLVDPVGFVSKFWKEDINHFSLGRNQKINKEEILKKIYDEYDLFAFEDHSKIFELRYKKKSKHSFQTYFQHATHLVTDFDAYKTSNTNFNFIFSHEEDRENQWDGLYSNLPILLYHSYEVTERLYYLLSRRAGESVDPTDMRLKIGYILWDHLQNGPFEKLEKILFDFLDFSKIKCPKCNEVQQNKIESYHAFYAQGLSKCHHCESIMDYNEAFETERDREIDMVNGSDTNKGLK